MLPHDGWRWIESDDGAFLHMHFGCVAVVRADGRVTIYRRRRPEVLGKVKGRESGKRYVERWLEAHGWIVF